MLYTLEKYLTQKLLMCGYTHINYLVNFKLFLVRYCKIRDSNSSSKYANATEINDRHRCACMIKHGQKGLYATFSFYRHIASTYMVTYDWRISYLYLYSNFRESRIVGR